MNISEVDQQYRLSGKEIAQQRGKSAARLISREMRQQRDRAAKRKRSSEIERQKDRATKMRHRRGRPAIWIEQQMDSAAER